MELSLENALHFSNKELLPFIVKFFPPNLNFGAI
jgi:hypothetical protein